MQKCSNSLDGHLKKVDIFMNLFVNKMIKRQKMMDYLIKMNLQEEDMLLVMDRKKWNTSCSTSCI